MQAELTLGNTCGWFDLVLVIEPKKGHYFDAGRAVFDAVQGPHGGYRIHSTMLEISLTKFIEDLEGPMGMVDCIVSSDCIQLNNCNIRQPINRINDNIRSIFSSINLSEITH